MFKFNVDVDIRITMRTIYGVLLTISGLVLGVKVMPMDKVWGLIAIGALVVCLGSKFLITWGSFSAKSNGNGDTSHT